MSHLYPLLRPDPVLSDIDMTYAEQLHILRVLTHNNSAFTEVLTSMS